MQERRRGLSEQQSADFGCEAKRTAERVASGEVEDDANIVQQRQQTPHTGRLVAAAAVKHDSHAACLAMVAGST